MTDNLRLNLFFDAYLECALRSSTYDDPNDPEMGAPLDDDFGPEDIEEGCKEKLREECKDFLEAHPEDPVTRFLTHLCDGDLERAGHDFWLTRNGHGAGFWDGDWNRPSFTQDWGKPLTERAKAYGGIDLYVGDDGKIYF